MPQNFAKSSPYFGLQYIQSKVRGRFRKFFVAFSEYMNFKIQNDMEEKEKLFTIDKVGFYGV